MAAVDQQLVRRPDGLVLLLTPPFDHTPHDPGYIKGYVPGIRENGGQYTHAAVWTLIAFAAMGDGDKAGELFRMLNPINRSNSRASVQRYKVEPYVVAGDIYAEAPHGARRMDVVHGLGWLALSRRAGMDSWIPRARHDAVDRSVHSAKLAGLSHRVSLSLVDLQDQGGKPLECHARRRPHGAGRKASGGLGQHSPRRRWRGHNIRIVLG